MTEQNVNERVESLIQTAAREILDLDVSVSDIVDHLRFLSLPDGERQTAAVEALSEDIYDRLLWMQLSEPTSGTIRVCANRITPRMDRYVSSTFDSQFDRIFDRAAPKYDLGYDGALRAIDPVSIRNKDGVGRSIVHFGDVTPEDFQRIVPVCTMERGRDEAAWVFRAAREAPRDAVRLLPGRLFEIFTTTIDTRGERQDGYDQVAWDGRSWGYPTGTSGRFARGLMVRMLNEQLDRRYRWHINIRTAEKRTGLLLATDAIGVQHIVQSRDVPVASRRPALQHFVREHWRRARRGDDSAVSAHFRGAKKFVWNGWPCEVIPAIYDQERVDASKASRLERAAERVLERAAVIAPKEAA